MARLVRLLERLSKLGAPAGSDDQPGEPAIITDSLTMPADRGSITAVRELMYAALERCGCPLVVVTQIDVALEELFVNVCSYAYDEKDAPGDLQVSFAASKNPPAIVVELVDRGIPFDPVAHADPTVEEDFRKATIGGWGIFMAKQSVDELTYVRDGDKNVVTFTKSW